MVREGTEGPYTGNGGAIRAGTPHEVATEVSLNTAFGVDRVVRYAFALARKRRKHLTLVHKTNVLTFAGSLWSRVVADVGAEYPDVEVAYQHIDAATIYMVTDPGRFDVIVTDNLFGDIITDLAAAVSGGIGLAASGNIDATGTNPSMFEPVHGSAPDIAGQGHRRSDCRGDERRVTAQPHRRGRRRDTGGPPPSPTIWPLAARRRYRPRGRRADSRPAVARACVSARQHAVALGRFAHCRGRVGAPTRLTRMRLGRIASPDGVAFVSIEGDARCRRRPRDRGASLRYADLYRRSWPLADVRLLAPILASKVVCMGKNYLEHVIEMGGDAAPEDPIIFLKPNTSIIGPGVAIVNSRPLPRRYTTRANWQW